MNNPYQTAPPGGGPFFGRAVELETLTTAIRTGRRSIAAVMGGRGMGKTSFALQLQQALHSDGAGNVYLLRKPHTNPSTFFEQLGRVIGQELDPIFPVESLVDAISALEPTRITLLIDEIEALVGSEQGRELLSNMRIAWEQLAGKLGVVIFGGSMLRELLASDTSPFLRTAQWIPLRGLSRDESAALLREPCKLALSDELVETLWENTAGHPLLLQAIMEHAVSSGEPVVKHIPEAIEHVSKKDFEPTIFPIWWDNLRERGQEVYRALLRHRNPVHRHEQVRVLGNEPDPWLEILETTGLVRREGDEALPRGMLFRSWMERNHPGEPPRLEAQVPQLSEIAISLGAGPFEERVVHSVTRWARDAVEYPAFFLKSDADSSKANDRLLTEQYFQLSLLMALRQQLLLVEAEALSVEGRSDLKVRWPPDTEQRACIELKIWGRNDYKDVVQQALGYAMPSDQFGCIVMIDRQARPLLKAYEQKVLSGVAYQLLWKADDGAVIYPALVTEHPRPGSSGLRIYHYLIQLPADGALP